METLIIQTESEKLDTLKSFLKEMNITFEVIKPKKKKEKHSYNPDFVKKILNTQNEKSIKINPTNLWESIQ